MKVLGVLLAPVLFLLSACGSGSHTGTPSTNGSYAWQPAPGDPSLVCAVNTFGPRRGYVDFRGRLYVCKVPSPADPHASGGVGVDFLGPTTVSADAVPLGPHAERLQVNLSTRRPAILRVDFGDGTHWERAVTPLTSRVDVVHDYTAGNFLLVTLRDKDGYEAVEGEGPLGAPTPGPHTRYCNYVSGGKGGTLSATPSLRCATAGKLFASLSPHGGLAGYRCRESGLPPAFSDVGLIACTRGARAFVFTSNQ